MTQAIRVAYSGVACRSHGHDKGNLWLNQTDKLARQTYKYQNQLALNSEKQKSTRKTYHNVVKKAKESFRAKVDQASTGKDIFAMTKWHISRGIYRSTPLVDHRNPERPPTTTAGKRQVLLSNLLDNSTDMRDILFQTPSVPVRSIFTAACNSSRSLRLFIRAGHTAPGLDEISTYFLKIAWPLVKEHIYALFSLCLFTGQHPKNFRHATLVIL